MDTWIISQGLPALTFPVSPLSISVADSVGWANASGTWRGGLSFPGDTCVLLSAGTSSPTGGRLAAVGDFPRVSKPLFILRRRRIHFRTALIIENPSYINLEYSLLSLTLQMHLPLISDPEQNKTCCPGPLWGWTQDSESPLVSSVGAGAITGHPLAWPPPGYIIHPHPPSITPEVSSLSRVHLPITSTSNPHVERRRGVTTVTHSLLFGTVDGVEVCVRARMLCVHVCPVLRGCVYVCVHWTEEAPLSHAQHRAWHRARNSKYLCEWIEHCTVWHVCSIFSLCSNIEFFNFPRRSQQGRWSWWSGWPGPRPPTGKPAGPSLFSPPLVLLWPATPSSTVCSGYLPEITLMQTLARWFEPCAEVGDCGYRRWHPREDEVGGALRTWLFLVWSMRPMSSLPTWLPVAGRGGSLGCEASATETLERGTSLPTTWLENHVTSVSAARVDTRLCLASFSVYISDSILSGGLVSFW